MKSISGSSVYVILLVTAGSIAFICIYLCSTFYLCVINFGLFFYCWLYSDWIPFAKWISYITKQHDLLSVILCYLLGLICNCVLLVIFYLSSCHFPVTMSSLSFELHVYAALQIYFLQYDSFSYIFSVRLWFQILELSSSLCSIFYVINLACFDVYAHSTLSRFILILAMTILTYILICIDLLSY